MSGINQFRDANWRKLNCQCKLSLTKWIYRKLLNNEFSPRWSKRRLRIYFYLKQIVNDKLKFLLDFVLVAVILLSNKYKVNPDNMATPLAASIGDVVSIAMLSFITSILFANLGEFCVWAWLMSLLITNFYPDTHLWTTYVVIAVYCFLLPFWVMIVLRNRYTRPVLKSGWIPVLSALFISG